MTTKDFNKLVARYGLDRANRAFNWYCLKSEAFRRGRDAYAYCVMNEGVWTCDFFNPHPCQ